MRAASSWRSSTSRGSSGVTRGGPSAAGSGPKFSPPTLHPLRRRLKVRTYDACLKALAGRHGSNRMIILKDICRSDPIADGGGGALDDGRAGRRGLSEAPTPSCARGSAWSLNFQKPPW